MIIETIKPIRQRESYEKDMAKNIESVIYWTIFKPLFNILDSETRTHSRVDDYLITAFRSGRIWYDDGYVYGNFNSLISKALRGLDGRFDKRKKAFKLPLSKLSPQIRTAMAQRKEDEQKKAEELRKATEGLNQEGIKEAKGLVGFQRTAKKVLADLAIQFRKVTPDNISTPLVFTEEDEERLAEEYLTETDLSIRGWVDEAIRRLRETVPKLIGEGYRADKLRDTLKAEYGISRSKAQFIARQETSVFVSKYRQHRYEQAGLTQYKWSTSRDERVRHDHKDLNNRIFSWDDPPIVDKATGRRGHPGEDFNCRCVALPVLKGAYV